MMYVNKNSNANILINALDEIESSDFLDALYIVFKYSLKQKRRKIKGKIEAIISLE